MDFTNGEFADNLERANNLIAASRQLNESEKSQVALAEDVLRAAVVFLHASLEEVIRNLYLSRLPNVIPEKLNEIPLISLAGHQRPTKILLGTLVKFRGELVENVIKKSIDAYVDTFNLNNTDELAKCLQLAEIHISQLSKHFPLLNELMKRRHQIVHQMDRTNELDPLTVPLSNLDIETVENWKSALESFVKDLFTLAQVSPDGICSTNRVLPFTAAQIYAAFTNADLLAQWWGPDGFTNTFEIFEFKPQGVWKFVMHGPDGKEYHNENVFLETSPQRIVVRHTSQPNFTLTVTLTEAAEGTRLDWNQAIDDAQVAASIAHNIVPANEQNLNRLHAVIASTL